MASNTIERLTEKDAFISHFHPASSNGVEVNGGPRKQAIDALSSLEIPTKKWEDWKYTQLKSIVKQEYKASDVRLDSIDSFKIPGLEADYLVFVNGKYDSELSDIQYNTNELIVQNLQTLSNKGQEVFDQHFGQYVSPDSQIFSAINTAYAKEGVLVYIPKGKATKAPIHIISVSAAGENAPAYQHRNLFVVEAHAEGKIIESQHSLGEGVSFKNSVTEIAVGEGAGLEFIKFQLESDQASQIDETVAHQAANSRFSIYTFTMSGKIVRNNLKIRMLGENGEAYLMGGYLLSGLQHVDHHTSVDHAVAHCYSNELYKGIIADKATGVFNGRINVYKDAQKTNAFQSNRNILMSDDANIFTKPQLEIYADDVKCSHGATTGRLDDDALFYLRARGIKEYDAKVMLIHAFAMETAENISLEPVKEYVDRLISDRY